MHLDCIAIRTHLRRLAFQRNGYYTFGRKVKSEPITRSRPPNWLSKQDAKSAEKNGMPYLENILMIFGHEAPSNKNGGLQCCMILIPMDGISAEA